MSIGNAMKRGGTTYSNSSHIKSNVEGFIRGLDFLPMNTVDYSGGDDYFRLVY